MKPKSTHPRTRRISGRKSSTPFRILVASDWAPIRAFDPVIRTDPEAVYGDMLPVLRSADLRVVNCECALTSSQKHVWKSGSTFKGTPEHVRALTAVPFEVACLANNHILDYGVAGLRESLRVLHRSGIRTVGAGLTEEEAYAPLTLKCRGSKVHIINVSEGEDLSASRGGPGVFGWDLDRAEALIRGCKKGGGGVIVVAHCGLEYFPYPPPYIVAAFRGMVNAGADCVIGHHPHVPQGIEWYRGKPIAYSLGNFVFYQQTGLYYRKTGFCVTLDVRDGSIENFSIHPYRITESGLRRLMPQEEKRFHRKISAISRPVQTPSGLNKAWQACLAYYGIPGFLAEVRGILEKMELSPQKGAAMFRNRLTTLQHAEQWRSFLTRIVEGGRTSYSRSAYRIVREWFTRIVA